MTTFSTIFILFTVFVSIYHVDSYTTTRESKAKKGNFFIHTLHSATLFNTTVPVKWSATLKDRPALPQWLHLVESRHSALAYLIGTPVTGASQLIVHVIAKRTDNFKSAQQFVVISLTEDDRFTKSTKQVLDLHIKNFEAESLLTDRNGVIGRLEQKISNTFRGRNVFPYIFDIRPEISSDKQRLLGARNIGSDLLLKIGPSYNQFSSIHAFEGSIVSVGTQKEFSSNIEKFLKSFHINPSLCRKNNQNVLNKAFPPEFIIDWCQTQMHNITLLHELTEVITDPTESVPIILTSDNKQDTFPDQPPREVRNEDGGFSFWESVLVFPMIAVTCIILILVLSLIFFGKREGQQWRDYKTPKEQLEEYVSVRESQRHLRELSVQRQLLLMSNDRDSAVPTGIHSFLQPKSRTASCRFSKSVSRLNDPTAANEDVIELLPATENVPVGKQTVAEAAKQCGSSLHLYRNPLESESEEENDSDSLDEKQRMTGF